MQVIAARTHVDCVECTSMAFHPQWRVARMLEHERWDRVFSATSLEMKQINDWLNLQWAQSASTRVWDSWVMTSVWLHDRSRCKPGASYQCGKSWFVNVMTDWKSNSSCIHRGKRRCPGMNSSIQMRVAWNWHRFRDKEDVLKESSMKVGILTRQPWNAAHMSIQVQKTLRYDAVRDQKRVLAVAHDVVRDQSLPWRKDMSQRPVASVEEGHESQRSRFRGGRTWVLNVSRRRCVLEFVSPDQAGERLMMRCHQYCGGATDLVHRQSSGYPGCARRWWFPFYEEPHMCVCSWSV